MNPQDRLRTALHDAADGTEVAPGSFDRIERRTARARRRRAAMGGGLAAVALVAVAVAVPLALRDDGGESVQAGPAGDTRDTTTTTDTTVAEPSPDAPTYDVDDGTGFLWPDTGGDPGNQFTNPEEAARTFGVAYLEMDRPDVEMVAPEMPGRARAVLRPRTEGGGRAAPGSGPRTIVDLAQVASGRPPAPRWYVIGASSPNIEVDAPQARTEVGSPIVVSGRARNLFEGNVIVDVRSGASPPPLVTGTTTAGGSGPALAPFRAELSYEVPLSGDGAIVVRSDSGIAGTPEATVVPVTFDGVTSGLTQVTVYLLDARQDFVPVVRAVPRTQAVLRAALEQLLAGASGDDEARGLTSPFDDDRDLLRGVTITADGTAVVDLVQDFGTRIPNSSASAMSAAILGSLDRTVFQFPSVVRVSYRFGGECGTFGEIDPAFLCGPRTRDEH